MNTEKLYQISFYVPESHLEAVKDNLFQAGAGKLGNYDHCSWQTKGIGQFRPKDHSKPYIGEIGKLEQVIEYKVEMICAAECLDQVIAALKTNHPYEEPAYSVIQQFPANKRVALNKGLQA